MLWSPSTRGQQSSNTNLRNLRKLAVSLAASVGRRHRRLVVVHKGPVDPQLTGLEGGGATD